MHDYFDLVVACKNVRERLIVVKALSSCYRAAVDLCIGLLDARPNPHGVLFVIVSTTGWAVFAALERAKFTGVPLSMLAEWWTDEDQADALTHFITNSTFPGSQLVERLVVY